MSIDALKSAHEFLITYSFAYPNFVLKLSKVP